MTENDDVLIGKLLNRRQVLSLLGGAGAAAFVACAPKRNTALSTAAPSESPSAAAAPAVATAVPACVAKPALTEGPFFVDEKLNRSDIREDREGAPLQLQFNVSKISGGSCTALEGATVDVWHCDAAGEYSDVQQNNTSGKKFLRGYQVSDGNGKAVFTTIYPGWYQGRAVHIHFKIRSGSREFTSQLFFDDSLSDRVYQQSPYSSRGQGDMRNQNDGIYNQGGSQLLLEATKSGSAYSATFDIALQM